MDINFTKMQSCGNDYIYINTICKDFFENTTCTPEQLAIKLSDRNYAIGGDGMILICSSAVADGKMRIFNADGSEGKMCGNGVRCVGKYLYDNKIANKDTISIETLSGIKTIEVTAENGLMTSGRVNMGAAILAPELIPVNLNGKSIINKKVKLAGQVYHITCVSMGNPHVVIFCQDADEIDLNAIGPLIENDPIFPEKVNVEFVQVISKTKLKIRVWERGSGITLGCGTGACAAVVAAVLNGYCDEGSTVAVKLPGGEVEITYTEDAVFMTGDAVKSFEGVVSI